MRLLSTRPVIRSHFRAAAEQAEKCNEIERRSGRRQNSLERGPRLQEPVETEKWLRTNVILELFPLTPAELVCHADLQHTQATR